MDPSASARAEHVPRQYLLDAPAGRPLSVSADVRSLMTSSRAKADYLIGASRPLNVYWKNCQVDEDCNGIVNPSNCPASKLSCYQL